MIITKEVTIKLSGSRLGKLRLKYPDKDLKKNDIITISISDLSKGSGEKVLCQCDFCDKITTMMYKDYLVCLRSHNIYTCNKCSIIKVETTNLDNTGYACNFSDPKVVEQIKQTNLKKIGYESHTQSPEFKEKLNQRNIERWGGPNPFIVEEFKEKAKQTNLEKRGVEYASQDPEFQKRVEETNLRNFGVKRPSQNPDIKEKARQTNQERRSVDAPMQDPDVMAKSKKTLNDVWGVDNIFQHEGIKSTIQQTMIDKWGAENSMYVPELVHKQQVSSYMIKTHPETNLNYQGGYEKDFLDRCVKNKITISKGKIIDYIFEDKSRKYFPDFYYELLNLIIEIKSMYTYNLHLEQNIEKEKATIKNGFNYIIITDMNYEEFDELIYLSRY
jgi:hypothetical protein